MRCNRRKLLSTVDLWKKKATVLDLRAAMRGLWVRVCVGGVPSIVQIVLNFELVVIALK